MTHSAATGAIFNLLFCPVVQLDVLRGIIRIILPSVKCQNTERRQKWIRTIYWKILTTIKKHNILYKLRFCSNVLVIKKLKMSGLELCSIRNFMFSGITSFTTGEATKHRQIQEESYICTATEVITWQKQTQYLSLLPSSSSFPTFVSPLNKLGCLNLWSRFSSDFNFCCITLWAP